MAPLREESTTSGSRSDVGEWPTLQLTHKRSRQTHNCVCRVSLRKGPSGSPTTLV